MDCRFYVIRAKEEPGFTLWLDWLETNEVLERINESGDYEIVEQLNLADSDKGAQILDALITFECLGSGIGMSELLTHIFLQGFELARKYPTEDIKE